MKLARRILQPVYSLMFEAGGKMDWEESDFDALVHLWSQTLWGKLVEGLGLDTARPLVPKSVITIS